MRRIYDFFADLAVIIERAYSGFLFMAIQKSIPIWIQVLLKNLAAYPEKDSWMPIVN
ncbi:hypothetical protein [Coxiella-like endosymbiont of Rhipicephalus sanguineus]|uniref:hypothetical protein n=1 Tax=Coxiella-like endosymbiont of Rhipicephalus sanguineus TaxID=1955402 RepID=UPI0020402CAF|nr:hypothetical protein [Coxiella-like endosymbiont of Rhipicephalus sanguineus]